MDQINEQNADFLRNCDELDDDGGDSDDDDDDESGGNGNDAIQIDEDGTCDGDLEELDADGVSILRETSSTLRISEAGADDVLLNNIAYARSERDLLGVELCDGRADEGRRAHGVRVLQDAKRLVAAANGDVCKQLLGARLLATYGKLLVLGDPGCGGGLKKNVSTTWDAPCDFRGVLKICLESIEEGDGGRRRLLEYLKTRTHWISALNRTVFPAFRKAGFTNGDLVCSRGMGVGKGTVDKATQRFPIALPGREESCTGPVQLHLRFPPVDQVIADATKAAEATHKNTVRDIGGASGDAATPTPTPGGDAIGSRLSSDRGRIVVGVDIPFGRTRAQFATVEHGILENLKEMYGVSSADLKVGGHVPEDLCKSGGERLGPGTWLEHKQKMKRLSHEEESRTNVAKRFAGVTGELARAVDRVRDSVRGALPEDVVLQVSASIAAVKAELPRFAREFGLAVPSGALPQPVDVDLAMNTTVEPGFVPEGSTAARLAGAAVTPAPAAEARGGPTRASSDKSERGEDKRKAGAKPKRKGNGKGKGPSGQVDWSPATGAGGDRAATKTTACKARAEAEAARPPPERERAPDLAAGGRRGNPKRDSLAGSLSSPPFQPPRRKPA